MPTHMLLKGSTLWVLNGHYQPPEDGLPYLTSSGANTIEVSDFALTDDILAKISAQNLRLVVQAYPEIASDIESTIGFAKKNKAVAINCHVRTPHLTHSESAELAKGLISRASDAGITLYFETHRGCITQDLYRTARLAEAVPDMRFTLDVSHYVVCEEVPGPVPKLASLLDPILERTEMIHGRISNGQQIQVHTIDRDTDLVRSYQAFWTEAMRRWRHRKPAGSSLIFTPELGPPAYAMVDAQGNELSNRLQQSEILWEIASAAWKQSATAGKTPAWPMDTD